MLQSGLIDVSSIDQSGITVTRTGNENFSDVFQFASASLVEITQTANGAQSWVDQGTGAGDTDLNALVTQTAAPVSVVNQSGSDGTAAVNQ